MRGIAYRRHQKARIRKKRVLPKIREAKQWQAEWWSRGFRSTPPETDAELYRRYAKNEGRHGRGCYDCGPHACDWCLEGFYRKHLTRSQALDNDLTEYLRGEAGDTGVDAPLMHYPQPMALPMEQ